MTHDEEGEDDGSRPSWGIGLKWFSVLAEERGARKERVHLPKGSTAHDLKNVLIADFPAFEVYRQQVRLAVNHEFADEDVTLSDGDEVAFLTPVRGDKSGETAH